MDPDSLEMLYTDESGGPPSQAEATDEYMPPEAVLNATLAYAPQAPWSYDSWSIGVLFMELILGSPKVRGG